MNHEHFTTSFAVDRTPEDVYDAIVNVRGWWSGNIEGDTDALDAEFTYRFEDVHMSTQHITELVRAKRVTWHVVDAYLANTNNPREWVGTDITFDIARQGDQTVVRFTHVGLVPQVECYDRCTQGWTHYLHDSLQRLVTTGLGQPNRDETAHRP